MTLTSRQLQVLKERLDQEVERVNVPSFAEHDPVQFARCMSGLRDIEVTALLTATLAWGKRESICHDCERLLGLMHGEPSRFVTEGAYEQLPDGLNVHRTFFARNLKHWCRTLRRIYASHPSLDAWAASHHVGQSEEPAWQLARLLLGEMTEACGTADSRCLPTQLHATALKRLNMALRWLVRDDGIVDLGVWHCIGPSQLFIPLDVHVASTARTLGLTTRRSNDRRTVLEITAQLRRMRPDDPVIYDYALFGLGMQQGNRIKIETLTNGYKS